MKRSHYMTSNKLTTVAIIACLFAQPAMATWSIIAVDRNTNEIGIAGASCTFDVQGIASIVPDKGAIVVQAASHYYARMQGVDAMEQGSSNEQVLQVMKDKKYTPSRQQYGVISLADSRPLVDTGEEVKGYKGHAQTEDVAVLGNILVSQEVITQALEAFADGQNTPFAQRLMASLKAGEQAGGDKRCGQQFARSAFLSVYQPENGAILKLSVYGIEPGGKPAVSLLNEEFQQRYPPRKPQK